jgi:hypothetical protein
MSEAVTLTLDDGRTLRGVVQGAGGKADASTVVRSVRLAKRGREVRIYSMGRCCLLTDADGTDHAVDLAQVTAVDGVAP